MITDLRLAKKIMLLKINFAQYRIRFHWISFSLAIAEKVKTIKVAGFDGYDQSDVNQDETDQIFKYFKVNIQNIKLPVSQKLD